MGIIYGAPLAIGGKKPSQLNVTTNGTWSKLEGYSPVNVNIPASAVTAGTITISNNGLTNVIEYQKANVSIPASAVTAGIINISNNGLTNVIEYQNANVSIPASAVTSGTKVITADGNYDVTNFKSVKVRVGIFASTSPIDGLSYTDGLPNDWNTIKEIAKAISEASNSINANTRGSVYVNKGNTWAYKITPGNTINVTSQIGTYTYAVMGFNNFALTNQGNYGGRHTTAGLTFGMVDCVGKYKMNSTDTTSGGWGQCLMRTSTMPTLKNGMPDTLAQVKVPYVDYNNQSTILYSDDYMFLPAEKEVLGTRSYSIPVEADGLTQFAYYKNGGREIKSLSGSAVPWWLRSAFSDDSAYFCIVNTLGSAYRNRAYFSNGAAPCFCV